MPREERSLEELLDQDTIPEALTGCWLCWKPTWGWYPRFYYKGKTISGHRASWTIHRGPIPRGINVLHRCDTPICVNPDHLFLGTQRDNILDCAQKNRHQRLRGLDNGNGILTDEQVLAIRADGRPQRAVAADYGINQSTVCRIKNETRRTPNLQETL